MAKHLLAVGSAGHSHAELAPNPNFMFIVCHFPLHHIILSFCHSVIRKKRVLLLSALDIYPRHSIMMPRPRCSIRHTLPLPITLLGTRCCQASPYPAILPSPSSLKRDTQCTSNYSTASTEASALASTPSRSPAVADIFVKSNERIFQPLSLAEFYPFNCSFTRPVCTHKEHDRILFERALDGSFMRLVERHLRMRQKPADV